ncbi:hypothetical protein F4776DRAFT_677265 [Hypoxylon sp. NC0597]|nr:hypothetical protein F4776DRAFT_677265 [Hypoxylon sp. NC0597]
MKKGLSSIFNPGWRRAGTINIICAFICGILILICLIAVISRKKSTIYSTTAIFEGDCQTTKWINFLIHGILSLLSTLIQASSRFFMQILCSPSRQEIDCAHIRLQSLEIGVSSSKNLRFVSYIKTAAWIVLLITSIPIHLLFNSSFSETSFQGSDWRLTIAAASFSTREVGFFLPGASLANAGAPSAGWDEINANNSRCSQLPGYGEHVVVTDYWNKSSPAYQNITRAAEESRLWYNISSQECRLEYASFIVVDTGTRVPEGWTRTQVFADPNDELGSIWDPYIPNTSLNSLWYSTQCAAYLSTSPVFYDAKNIICINTCGLALGLDTSYLFTNTSSISESGWAISSHKLGYNKPSPTYTCQVGFSKVLTYMLVTCYLPSTSLVTLGDALESFISDPDPITRGLGTFSISDSHRLQYRAYRASSSDDTIELSDKVKPRLWRCRENRLIYALPKSAWSGTFIPIGFFICIAGYYINQIEVFRRLSWKGTIGTSETPFFAGNFVGSYGYFRALLVANLPQFLLSYCFYSYNTLVTRLLAEKEFNSYSVAPHKPLRVSYPKGDQVSTYWLQLPYQYSVPLLIASASLHWLASNSLFIYASQGAVLGFSPLKIVGLSIACLVLASIPILYATFYTLPGDMVVGACDSLVLSAACHAYVPSVTTREGDTDVEGRPGEERKLIYPPPTYLK